MASTTELALVAVAFFLAYKELRGKISDKSIRACDTVLSFFFFLMCRSAHAQHFRSLNEGQQRVAQQADDTVTECSLTVTVCMTVNQSVGKQMHKLPSHPNTE